MGIDRYVSTQFCDDVRHETGGKYSLIGCFGSELQVSRIPSMLPKLCAYLKAYTGVDKPFGKLIFKIYRDESVVAEVAVSLDKVRRVSMRPGAQGTYISAFIILSPFAIDAPCVLRVEAETEDAPIYGGRLWIAEAHASTGTGD